VESAHGKARGFVNQAGVAMNGRKVLGMLPNVCLYLFNINVPHSEVERHGLIFAICLAPGSSLNACMVR
jgi:hypothetical protein